MSKKSKRSKKKKTSRIEVPEYTGTILDEKGNIVWQPVELEEEDAFSLKDFLDPVIVSCGHVHMAAPFTAWYNAVESISTYTHAKCPVQGCSVMGLRSFVQPANKIRKKQGLKKQSATDEAFAAHVKSLGFEQDEGKLSLLRLKEDHEHDDTLVARLCNCTPAGGDLLPQFCEYDTYQYQKGEMDNGASWCGDPNVHWGKRGACVCLWASWCANPWQSPARSCSEVYCHLTLGKGSSYCSRSLCGTCCPCWAVGYVGVCIFQILFVILVALCLLVVILAFPLWIIPVGIIAAIAFAIWYKKYR